MEVLLCAICRAGSVQPKFLAFGTQVFNHARLDRFVARIVFQWIQGRLRSRVQAAILPSMADLRIAVEAD